MRQRSHRWFAAHGGAGASDSWREIVTAQPIAQRASLGKKIEAMRAEEAAGTARRGPAQLFRVLYQVGSAVSEGWTYGKAGDRIRTGDVQLGKRQGIDSNLNMDNTLTSTPH